MFSVGARSEFLLHMAGLSCERSCNQILFCSSYTSKTWNDGGSEGKG